MKAKILSFLIALFAMSACLSGCSSMNSNGYQYSAGSYYVIQEAKQEYVDSLKDDSYNRKQISAERILRFFLDYGFFVPNLIYYPLTGGTIFGTFGDSSSSEELASIQRDFKIGSLQNSPDADLEEVSNPQSSYKPLRIYGDLVLAVPNLVYYSVTGETFFGTFRKETDEETSLRVVLARKLLRNAAVQKNIPFSSFLEDFSFANIVAGAGSRLNEVGRTYYFTSDGLMNRFDAETFGQLLTDANLVLDDLDLSAEDVEELKQNGYLDFVEDDAKSVPTFEAAPVKGKKK